MRFGQYLFPDFADFQIGPFKGAVQLAEHPDIFFRIRCHGSGLIVVDIFFRTDGAGDDFQDSQRNFTLRAANDLLLQKYCVKILWLAVSAETEVAHGIVDDAVAVFFNGLQHMGVAAPDDVRARVNGGMTHGLLVSGGNGMIVVPNKRTDCIVIPQGATFEAQDRVFVYKIVDGKASASPVVVTRTTDGRSYVVESGLNVGDVIVAEGAGLLREGTPIKAKESQPATSAPQAAQ